MADETQVAAERTAPGSGTTPHVDEPEWLRPTIRFAGWRLAFSLAVGGLALIALLGLLDAVRSVLYVLFISLFLSFALEPAVNWLSSKGMRRGFATGLIFLAVLVAVLVMIGMLVPAIVSGISQLIDNLPQILDTISKYTERWFNVDLSSQQVQQELQQDASRWAGYASDIAGNVLTVTGTIVGEIFRFFTIALFTFYMVAEGPKMRRAICRRLPPRHQQRILFVWNEAIDKTGGYFYSRLLLAVINGGSVYILLRVLDVPFAAPLAVFTGVVAEFIPIVGTYIGGAAPILVAFVEQPSDGVIVLAWIVVYQQLENYFLSPRITARTMALHPAIAFAAALVGGALGGLLTAFLALPVAGVLQAAFQTYAEQYHVVEDELTKEPPPIPSKQPSRLAERIRRQTRDVASKRRRSENPQEPRSSDEPPAE